MARTLHHVCTVDATPQRVCEVMSSAAFEEAQYRLQGAVADAEVAALERRDGEVTYEVRLRTYKRGLRGLDRSATEPATVACRWDLERRVGTWQYASSMGARLLLEGTITIEAQGSGARVSQEARLRADLPLVARAVEALIARELEAGWPAQEELIGRLCRD